MTHRNWTIEALLAEPSVHPMSPWRVLGPKATGPTQWLTGAYGSLKAIAWSPDAQRIAAGSQKGGTGVWESDTATPHLLEGHTRPITALAWAKHRLIGRAHVDDPVEPELFSASADGTIAIWSGGEIRGRLRGHQGPVTCIDITHDAGVVVSGSDDKSIRIWDRNAGTLQELLGHKSWVTSVAIHPDGASILSGSADATLVHWQLDDGQGVPWYGHVDAVTSVAFLDDGEHAVSAAKDGTIKVWSVTKGEVITFAGTKVPCMPCRCLEQKWHLPVPTTALVFGISKACWTNRPPNRAMPSKDGFKPIADPCLRWHGLRMDSGSHQQEAIGKPRCGLRMQPNRAIYAIPAASGPAPSPPTAVGLPRAHGTKPHGSATLRPTLDWPVCGATKAPCKALLSIPAPNQSPTYSAYRPMEKRAFGPPKTVRAHWWSTRTMIRSLPAPTPHRATDSSRVHAMAPLGSGTAKPGF